MARWHGNNHAWIDATVKGTRRGMALARAELTGPSLSRLRPKLQETALALWTIYIILTVVEIILLWFLGGMTMFDAFNHGLTTMPSGGFSTHDASIAYYDSFVVNR